MENTDNMVSGKIIKKWVKPGTRGNTIGFIILDHGQEKMVSVFESKLSPELKNVVMALVEGMFAEFEVVSNVSKTDGKTYLNIVTATPITQLREDAEQPAQSNRLDSRGVDIGKIVGTCTQYAVLYANQKMAITKEVVPIDEVKEIAMSLSRFEEEAIRTWGE
jgi:hypothetical protein